MKFRLASALALTLAFSSIVSTAAFAETQAAPAFRTAEATSFSTADLQAYGLSASDATQVADLQAQGYTVQVISPEEASKYQAGMSTHTWLIIGLVVVVVAVVAASN